MNFRKLTLSVLVFIVLGAGIFALIHSDKQAESTSKTRVAASYYPLYEFSRQVAGDTATVVNLTPAGAEPHEYEPAPRTISQTYDANVFVYNGGSMEPWTETFVKEYKNTAVKASRGIPLRDGEDPHFWLDPALAQQIVNNIRDGLSAADPVHATIYKENARQYNQKLQALDKEFASGLQACSNDTVISSHEAFGYVAAKYGFKVEAIAGVSSEQEPSAARLAEITNIVRQKGLTYIFFEQLVSPRLADTIARETGAKTLVFDPIEGLTNEDQKQGKDYIRIQRENLQALKTALACS